jgi:hypothetical protein
MESKEATGAVGYGRHWRKGRKNDTKVWRTIIKRCIDTEKRNMEVNMREKR